MISDGWCSSQTKFLDVTQLLMFLRFMDNLQTEVLEIEFNEFARGKQTITESDFARILLRYTSTTMDDKRNYIERLHERLPNEGVLFFSNTFHVSVYLIIFYRASLSNSSDCFAGF